MNGLEVKKVLKKMPFKNALLWVGIMRCSFDLGEQYCELTKKQTTIVYEEGMDQVFAPDFYLPQPKKNNFLFPKDQITIIIYETTEEKLLNESNKTFRGLKKEILGNFEWELEKLELEIEEEG